MRNSQIEVIKKTSTNQIDYYESEIRRFKQTLEQRERDIEEWKSRYAKLEVRSLVTKSYDDRLKDYELRIDTLVNDLKNKLDDIDSLRLKNSKLEMQLAEARTYEEEAKKLRDILDYKLNDSDHLRSAVGDLTYQVSREQQKLHELEEVNIRLQEEVIMLREQLKKADKEKQLHMEVKDQLRSSQIDTLKKTHISEVETLYNELDR